MISYYNYKYIVKRGWIICYYIKLFLPVVVGLFAKKYIIILTPHIILIYLPSNWFNSFKPIIQIPENFSYFYASHPYPILCRAVMQLYSSCTTLHCTMRHCMHCTAYLFIAVHYTALHWTTLHCAPSNHSCCSWHCRDSKCHFFLHMRACIDEELLYKTIFILT